VRDFVPEDWRVALSDWLSRHGPEQCSDVSSNSLLGARGEVCQLKP
jgi:hypothetical protein